MSLSLEILNNLYGFSLAKYATWFYYKPDNLLFDAGEGVSVAMRNMIYGIDAVVISHGHGDHIAGLPGLLRSRASSMGDKFKPMTIYYPKEDRSIIKLYRYIKETVGKLTFEMEWKEISSGDNITLASNRILVPFATNHGENCLTLGYKIVENRVRLKPQYRELKQSDLVKIIQQEGKQSVSETYSHNLLCFSGDSMALDPKICENAEVLLHDSTFLNSEDRDENTHATVSEAIQVAIQAKVGILALFHFSARYRYNEVIETVVQTAKKMGVTFPIFLIFSTPGTIVFKKVC